MSEAGLDAAARSLRAWLNTQHFTDLPAPEVTDFLTASAVRWAHGLGYNAFREVRLPAAANGRIGRLDLQFRHRSGRGRHISIEIDRGNKLWSLDKLTHAADAGDLALWVRWSRHTVPVPIPPTVRLIRAHVIRRTVPTQRRRYTLQPDNCG